MVHGAVSDTAGKTGCGESGILNLIHRSPAKEKPGITEKIHPVWTWCYQSFSKLIRGEHSAIRNFLNDICQDENEDICAVTPAQMEDYFKKQRQRPVQAETYNKNVMCIQHFFNFLKVRQYIERITKQYSERRLCV